MLHLFKYIAVTLIVAAYSLNTAAQVKTDGKSTEIDGVIRFDKTVHDFGDVTVGQGALTCTFKAENIGSKAIVIYNVVTSCGCTGVKWTREPILPGKSGFITITYSNDEGPYPFDKTVTAYISGIKKPVLLRLRGVAHEKQLSLSELFPIKKGSLGLKKTELKLGNLSQGGQRSDAVSVANLGNTPLSVSFKDVSEGLEIGIEPNPIPVGKTAKMTYIVTADRSRWGKNYYYATPVVNDKVYSPIDIWAFTKEDFSSWSDEEINNGPQPIFDASSYDFGKIRKGTSVSATFKYRNLGGSSFHIYKADAECSCVTVPERFADTASGGSGSIKFNVNTADLPSGDNDIAIILTTNSPLRPVISLYISGNIY